MRKQGSTTIAANGSSGNVLAGDVIELPERPSRVRFYAAASAAGVVGTVRAGSRTLMTESAISQANRFPIDPDDRMVQDVAMQSQRLQLEFRNTTAGPLTVYWACDSDPVA
jgi:hypothetical protein